MESHDTHRSPQPAIALLASGVATFVPQSRSGNTGQPSTKTASGRYTADPPAKHSPLDQITPTNPSKLEVAWRFKIDNLGPRPENKPEGTPPIMVKGTVMRPPARAALSSPRRQERARDEADGAMDEGEKRPPAGRRPRVVVSYWTDGRGDERILYVTTGYRLLNWNAKTGVPIQSFGTNGVIDPKVGVVIGKDKQLDSRRVKSACALDAHRRQRHRHRRLVDVRRSRLPLLPNAKGLVRAFDVKTGKQIWRFKHDSRPW